MLEGETSMEKHKQGRDLGDARGASMGEILNMQLGKAALSNSGAKP